MTNYFIPEVLSPAGSLDKLKVAINYGADAVYLGGQQFGLRAASDNFTYEELEEGVLFAHGKGRKVYVVLNSFLHDKDIEALPPFVEYLDSLSVDAVIVSDLGVIETVHKYSKIPVHLSTQASCLNVEAAKLWKKMGVTRIVTGRELSIEEAGKLKKEAGIEIEMFVHGSMCMAYSGNCVISNYTQGRDSNRGGCAHSCRFQYSIDFKNDLEKKKAYFMSSKDLNGIRVLEEYIKHGIDSIKIEGRMKSHLYAGTMSKIYKEALDYYKEHGNFLSDKILEWEEELGKVTHRAYTEASLIDKAGEDSIFDERETDSSNEFVMVGRVIEKISEEEIVLEVRNAFNKNDELELVPFVGPSVSFKADKILDLGNMELERTKPSTVVKLKLPKEANLHEILRMRASL